MRLGKSVFQNIRQGLATALTVSLVLSAPLQAMAAGWMQKDTRWYHYNSSEQLDTGWYLENGIWYFLDTRHDGVSGSALVNGWYWIDGYCYYFNADGALLTGCRTPDGYDVNADGRWTENGVVQFVAGKGLSGTENLRYRHTSYEDEHDGETGDDDFLDDLFDDLTEEDLVFLEELLNNVELLWLFSQISEDNTNEEKDALRSALTEFLEDLTNKKLLNGYQWDRSRNQVVCEYTNGVADVMVLWEPKSKHLLKSSGNTPSDAAEEEADEEQELQYDLEDEELWATASDAVVPCLLSEGDRPYTEETPEDPILYNRLYEMGHSETKNGDALILSSFPKGMTGEEAGYTSEYDRLYQSIIHYETGAYTCQYRYAATVEDYKKLAPYGLIIINSHGLLVNDAPTICLEEKATAAKNKKYSKDLAAQRIIIGTTSAGKQYILTPKFFQYYYGNDELNGSMIYAGFCHGFASDDLAEAFLTSGATAYTGYSNAVYASYDNVMVNDITGSMLKGDTLLDAAAGAVDKYGRTDLEYVEDPEDEKGPAELKIGGDETVKLFGSTKQEVSEGTVTSTESPNYVTSTIHVPMTAATLEFYYDFATCEPVETDEAFDDTFEVNIYDEDGNREEVLKEDVKTSEMEPYEEGMYHTNLQKVSYDIRKYRGKVITVGFWVYDKGDHELPSMLTFGDLKV